MIADQKINPLFKVIKGFGYSKIETEGSNVALLNEAMNYKKLINKIDFDQFMFDSENGKLSQVIGMFFETIKPDFI